MTQFIAEHPFIFTALCVFVLFTVSDVAHAWANAWVSRKSNEKEDAI